MPGEELTPRERAEAKTRERNESWQARLAEQAFQRTATDAKALYDIHQAQVAAGRAKEAVLEGGLVSTDIDPSDRKFFGGKDKAVDWEATAKGLTAASTSGVDIAAGRGSREQIDYAKSRWQSDFVEAYEIATALHRDELPREFWMQFSSAELRLFGEGIFEDEKGMPVHETIAAQVEYEQWSYALQLERDQEVERRFEEMTTAKGATLSSATTFIPVLGSFVALYKSLDEGLTGEAVNDSSRWSEEQLANMRENIRKDVWGAHAEGKEDEIEQYLDDEMGFIQMVADGLEDPSDIDVGDIAHKVGTTGLEGLFDKEYTPPGVTLPNGTHLNMAQYRTAWDNESNALWALGVRSREELTPEYMEELRATKKAELEAMLNAMPDDHERLLQFGAGISPGAQLGQDFGTIMDKGFQFAGVVVDKGGVITAPFKYVTMPVFEWIIDKTSDDKNESMERMRVFDGSPDAEVLTRATLTDVDEIWDEMEPETQDEYVQMGLGDLNMAKSFLQADMLGSIDPDEQIEYLQNIRDQDNTIVEQMADLDFTTGDRMLKLLGDYNRLGPMRLASYTTLLLTDEDFFDHATTGQWGEFFGQLETKAQLADYSPAQLLDMEGSLAGLLLDLGGGIMFDPLTWIFAPAGAARGGAAQSARAVQAFKKSAYAERTLKDLVVFGKDPSKGPASMFRLMDWMDPVSRAGFIQKLGWNPKVMPKGAWRNNPNKAVVVRRELLEDMMGPDEIRKVSVDDIDTLRPQITERGFDEALEITYSRADGNWWVSDGAKRLMAADDISHLPVRVRVTDSVAPSINRVVAGYGDDTVRLLEKTLASKASGEVLDASSLEKVLDVSKQVHVRGDGVLRGTIDAGEETLQVFSYKGNHYYAVNSKGEVVSAVQSQIGTLGTYAGNDLSGKILRLAHENGDDLIKTVNLTSISKSGKGALDKYIRGVFEDTLPQGRRVGVHTDDLLQEGESLAVQTKKATGNVGDVHVRPDAILPWRLLHGDVPMDDLMEIMAESVARGSTPNSGQYAAIASQSGMALRKLLSANAPGRWLQRHVGAFSNTRMRGLAGPRDVDDLVSDVYRLYGDDTASINMHLERLFEFEQKTHLKNVSYLKRLKEVQLRQARVQTLKDKFGPTYATSPSGETAARVAQRHLIVEEDKVLRRMFKEIDADSGVIGSTDELEQIYMEIWEHYKTNYIETLPGWKKFLDPKTGKLDWEHLTKGPKKPPATAGVIDADRAVTESMQSIADDLGVDAEGLMQQLAHMQNAKLSTTMPASPLEMILASSVGGAAYSKALHHGFVNGIREGAMAMHRLWTIDKVFTLATAGTVSFDELLRIFHRFGAKSITRWARDRAMFMDARRQAIFHGKGVSVRKGAQYLGPKRQERLRVLKDQSQKYKNLERSTHDSVGLGYQDMMPKDAGFDDAARAWSGGMVQDSGFRAFLRGKEDFKEWFFSPDGERLRKGVVMSHEEGVAKTLFIDSADEFYQGWENLFEVILQPARKAGKYDEVLAAWKSTAEKVSASGGISKDVPDIVIQHLESVRGLKKEIPSKVNVSALTDTFFEKMFQDPINYRRGFLADQVRTHEKARLINLMNDQGRRVVTDLELESLLGLQGLAGSTRTGLQGAIHEMALKSGYVPESFLDDLVERAVQKEIEHTLYQFEMGSRLGSQARAVFPFAKPWADMAAFWGRETIRKPVLRGWINEKNAFGLRTLNDAGLLSFPVPNRAFARISQFANTDFTIDKGLIGDVQLPWETAADVAEGQASGSMVRSGGLLPGSESSNFSPLFFLPTEGENPFSYMLPGFGILPVAFLDVFMAAKYDPVDQPEEYQQLQSEIGQIIPSVQYQQGGMLSRVMGGGSVSKLFGMATDITGLVGHNSFFNLTSATGDIGRELDRTREVSALLADPDELELLLSAETVEEAEELLEALAIQADINAGNAHLQETFWRFMAPVSHQFDGSIAEIQDVWLDATQFPELAYLNVGDPESMTDEQRRQAAADVRSAFFSLDGWQRDALVVQQPSLAVNMVGSWEWTAEAINQTLEGTDYAYRTGGTREDLARHEALVRQGLVRPVQPIVRARRILGVVNNAKRDAAKALYSNQVDQVNDLLWGFAEVDEEVVNMLELVLESPFAETYDLRTPEEVWRMWSRIEEDLEYFFSEELGIDPVRGISTKKDDLTAFDKLRRAVKIPENFKPWGDTFPGLDEENVSARFTDWELVSVDDQTKTLAKALGIHVDIGMTGGELFEEVQQIITQAHNPIYDVARPEYDRYIRDRSNSSGRNMMFELAQSGLISEDMQAKVHEFLFVEDMMQQRRTEDRVNGITLADQNRIRREFMFILNGSKDQKTDWEGIWSEQYEKDYGPLAWTPPLPRSPFDENGNLIGAAMTPEIREIVDGDTILVGAHPGGTTLNSWRLLGIRAPEIGGPDGDAALDAEEALKDAIVQGVTNGDRIYLVRDQRFGNTDHYGRGLAWLWIGDTPYYNEEDLRPHQDPSGGDN